MAGQVSEGMLFDIRAKPLASSVPPALAAVPERPGASWIGRAKARPHLRQGPDIVSTGGPDIVVHRE